MKLDQLLHGVRTSRPRGSRIRDWSVYATETRRLALGTRDCETGNVHSPLNLSESLGARYLFVWDDGRVSRGALEKRQLTSDVDDALAQARTAAYEDPDAARVRGPASFPEVELHDPRVALLLGGDTEPLERLLAGIRHRFRRGGFRTWSGSFAASEARSRLVTSAGLDVAGSGTGAAWHASFDGEWGDGFGARSLESEEDYNARLARLAQTVRLLEAPTPSMPGGEHRILLHPHVVEEFVLGTLLRNLDGATVAHGEGHFREEQFNGRDAVVREDLTLRLDPLRPLRAGSYRFTTEGVPAARHTYIEAGRLVSPILDVKYANRLGRKPTAIPFSVDTLDLEAPEIISADEAHSAARGGVLVLGVLGVHTQDPASGDFSLSAPQALKIGNEGPVGRLRGTVSGNLFRLLRSDSLRLVRFAGEHTPGLLVSCRFDPA